MIRFQTFRTMQFPGLSRKRRTPVCLRVRLVGCGLTDLVWSAVDEARALHPDEPARTSQTSTYGGVHHYEW